MDEKIAMGFHTCVDYELIWDKNVIEEQIKRYNIHNKDLEMNIGVLSERDILITALAHLKEGVGCEIIPETERQSKDFAEHFKYKITLGGTATRAAIAISNLGYPSLIQTSCYNEYVRKLLPPKVRAIPGIKGKEIIYPHIVLQCAGGVRIKANDIDFITPRENRILISYDEDSLNLPVLEKEFGNEIKRCEVFLLGSFTEILDFEILKDRIEKTSNMLSYLPDNAIVVMEDGCYIKEEFRHYIHSKLASRADILSMNEDELQKYIGHRINIMDKDEVMDGVKYIYNKTGIKNILVHSAAWVIVYGNNARKLNKALESGIAMSATRFRKGDDFNKDDYLYTKNLNDKSESKMFCQKLEQEYGENICCRPCKDLSFVEHPTVVGLGDAFAGGLVIGLLERD